MEFILASSNAHKAEELDALLNAGGLKIISAPSSLDVIEDGLSFSENAYIKAKAYYEEFKKPSLADDSGLVLESMPEILGIHSARFASEAKDYKEKNQILLRTISHLKEEQRRAYFVCYLCFYLNKDEVYYFEGRVHGRIGDKALGDGGFGYDPVFIPDGDFGGASLAELSEWKMQNSHRARASMAAVKFFSSARIELPNS